MFDEFMAKQKFNRSEYDPCVYYKESTVEDRVYLLLYVDDMLIASKKMSVVQSVKDQLSTEFEMKDLEPARRILGMDIFRDGAKASLVLSQNDYLSKVLKTFGMENCRAVSTPLGSQFKQKSLSEAEEALEAKEMENVPYSSAVGSLMYTMVGSRPDLAYAVKWIRRYIQGALKLNLTFTKEKDFVIRGYCDSDYAADLDRRRSIESYVFMVGGNTVSWRSTLQKVVALSTTEAEYISLSEAIREGIWLKGICKELRFSDDVIEVNCDSQSEIYLSRNYIYRETKKAYGSKV